jgi:2',3'-cyclic-nucleotide 2'-phosphodiesterase (5'-nucleotidase family)
MNLVKATLLSFLVLAAPAAEAADVSLLYNGSVRAELKDCGCKSLPLGGLARRAALIGSISQDRDVLLIDAGNLLGDPTRDTLAQSSFVAKHTAEIGYTTVGVGPYEFGHGIDAVQDIALASGLEFVSANLTVNGERPFAPWTVVERGGVKFGLISVVDMGYDRAPYNEKVEGLQIEDPVAALKRELPALREKCDVVVLLANMERSDGTVGILRAMQDGPEIEIVVEGAVARQYKTPRKLGDSLVVAANARGKYLGQLDLTVEGGQISGTEGEIHALVLELPEDESIATAVKDFESKQEEMAASR